jgi:mRNA interferase HigB
MQTFGYDPLMNVIALRTLRTYWAKPSNAKAEIPLKVWYKAARKAEWTTLLDVKNTFPATDHITADRLVFDVGGNKWRIVARVDYQARMVFIRWVGDHKAYDKIDAATV